jgi:sialic acid synthase SpsE
MSIKIGKFGIGSEYPPFVIAEMSGNHNQSLDRALVADLYGRYHDTGYCRE